MVTCHSGLSMTSTPNHVECSSSYIADQSSQTPVPIVDFGPQSKGMQASTGNAALSMI